MLQYTDRAWAAELARFAIVGGASVAVYAATIFLCAAVLGLNVAAATIPAYLASMALNYTLQKIWTFKSDARHAAAIPKYLFVHAVGMTINFGVVEMLVNVAGASYLPAQAAAVALVAAWSYVAQKYWTFAAKKATQR